MSTQVKDLKLTDTIFNSAADIIDDTAETTTSTYSSDKISTELGSKLTVSSGNTAGRPSTLGAGDAGLYGYYDTDTGGFVIWTGSKWTDQ